MAGASDKKRAISNAKVLKEIHTISLVVNLITILVLFYFKRPAAKKYYIVLSVPALACQYVLEKTGRPRYENNAQGYSVLTRAGEDLQQSGLTEYMFDIIYLTLIMDVLMVTTGSNKVWLLYLAVPAFAAYKLKGVFGGLLGMIRGPGASGGASDNANGSANGNAGEATKSKRQAKLEARRQRPKTVYR